MAKAAPLLLQQDYEEARWNFIEKSCMSTSQNKLMIGNLPKGWNHQKPTIARLRGLADKYCRASSNPEVCGRGPRNEEIVFRLEDDGKALYRYVSGVRCTGQNGQPNEGRVMILKYSTVQGGKNKKKPAKKKKIGDMEEVWVEDQEHGACCLTMQALYALGSFAFQAGVKHNIPDEVVSLEIVQDDADVGSHALIGFKKKYHAANALQGLQKEQITPGRSLLVAWAREQWPLWTTNSTDLAIYGIGFQLYFYFMRIFGLATLLGAVLGFPVFVGCLTGDALNALQDVATANVIVSFLTNTTIANLGVLTNDTSVDPPMIYRKVNFMNFDIRMVTMFASMTDAGVALLIFALAFWFEHWHIPRVTASFAENVVNAEAWAVFIDHLPAWSDKDRTVDREKYGRKLTEHFESILRAQLDPRKIKNGTLVVKKRDRGERTRKSCCDIFSWLFCGCCRRSGRDLRGRILGKVLDVDKNARRCRVRWLDKAAKVQEETCQIDDLLDANLLGRLQNSGCGEDSHHRSECLIHEVSLVVDYDGELKNMKEKYAKHIEKSQSMHSVKSTKAGNKKADFDPIKHLGMEPKKQAVEGAFIIFSRSAHRDFILREYRFSRTTLRSCCLRRRLRFMRNPIRVREAAPPGDIFWDNMDSSFDMRMRRRLIVGVSCIVLTVTVFVFCSYAKQAGASANEDTSAACPDGPITNTSSVDCQCNAAGLYGVYKDVPPGIYSLCEDWVHKKAVAQATSTLSVVVILLVSLSANTVAERLSKALHPVSLTSMDNFTFNISFILQTLILTMITVLVYWKFDGLDEIELVGKGSYQSITPEWYLVVGGPILFTLVVNLLYPGLGALQVTIFNQGLYWCRHRKRNKAELLKLYTPPKFPLALRQAEQMCGFFSMLVFSSGMPLLYLFIPFYLSYFYWSDKYALLRASITPPMYGPNLVKNMVRWLQFAILLHALFGVYVYGEPESSPSYCRGCDEDVSLGKFQVSNYHSNGLEWAGETEDVTFLNKLSYLSAIPSFLLALFIGGVYATRLTLYIIGESFGSMYVILSANQDETSRVTTKRKSTRGAPTSESQMLLSGPFTRAMHELNRLGKASSYDISKASGYEFLPTTGCQNTFAAQEPKAPPVAPTAPARKSASKAPKVQFRPQEQKDSATTSLKAARCDAPTMETSWPAAQDGPDQLEEDQEYRVQVQEDPGGRMFPGLYSESAQEETFDMVHPGTMCCYDNPEVEKEPGKHRTTTAEALIRSNSVIGVEIDMGAILECQCQGFIFERGLLHLNAIIGQVEEGDIVEAAGPPEIEYGYLMLPIIPCGTVEMTVIMGNGDGFTSEVADADDEESSGDEEERNDSMHSVTTKPVDIGIGTKLVCIREPGADIFQSLNSEVVIGEVKKGETVEAAGTPVEVEGSMLLPLYPQGAAELSCFRLASEMLKSETEVQPALKPQAVVNKVNTTASAKSSSRPKSKSKKKSSS